MGNAPKPEHMCDCTPATSQFGVVASVKSTINTLGALAGILSLSKLLSMAHNTTIGEFQSIILAAWRNFVSDIFLPIEPIARKVGEFLSQFMGLSVDLGEHWRYFFIALTFYFFRNSQVTSRSRAGILIAGLELVIGVVIAFFASVAVGSFDASSRDEWTSLLIVSSIIIAVLLYDLITLIMSSQYDLRQNETHQSLAFHYSFRSLLAVLVSCLLLFSGAISHYPSPSLLTLLVLLVLLAASLLGRAVFYWRDKTNQWTDFSQNVARDSRWRLGVSMIGTMIAVVFFTFWSFGDVVT